MKIHNRFALRSDVLVHKGKCKREKMLKKIKLAEK